MFYKRFIFILNSYNYDENVKNVRLNLLKKNFN